MGIRVSGVCYRCPAFLASFHSHLCHSLRWHPYLGLGLPTLTGTFSGRRTGLAAWLHSLVGGGSRSGGGDASNGAPDGAAAAESAPAGYSVIAQLGQAGGGAAGGAASTSGPQARCFELCCDAGCISNEK